MKDQYFGDKRDYLKYHVLETMLARVPSLRQLTCFWMLTPNDNTHQGNVALLPSPELPELTSFLNSHLQDDKRTVSLLRSYFEDAGIKYNPVGDAGPPYFSASNRSSYFRKVPDDLLQGALIFIDPDNGISFKQSNTKQVSWNEINELWKRADDDAVLAIVQFAQRKPEFFPQRAQELEQHLQRTIFWIQEYPFAIYFCAKSGRNDDLIQASLHDVASIGRNRVVGNSSTWKTHESRMEQSKVYLLWHSHDEDFDDSQLLGVYSSRVKAESRKEEASFLPGFRKQPSYFDIAEYALDQDEWQEGTDELGPLSERPLEVMAARYRIGIATPEELHSFGEWLVLNGVDAGVPLAIAEDLTLRDLSPVFEEVCENTHTRIPDERDAVEIVISDYCQRIESEDSDPEAVLDELIRAIDEILWKYDQEEKSGMVGRAFDLETLVGIYWTMDDEKGRAKRGALSTLRLKEFQEQIRAASRKWLEDRGYANFGEGWQ